MASLKDIKVNINVDTTDFIKSLRQLQEIIKMKLVKEFIPNQAIWAETNVLNKVNDFCKQNKVVDIIPKVFVAMDQSPMLAYIVIYEVEK